MLRTIFTQGDGANAPSMGKLAGELGYYPLLQIDDETGRLYNGGVEINSDDPLQVAHPVVVPVTSAQLLNMKASPIVLISALGAGFTIHPTQVIFQYLPVSVDYTLGDATGLYIGSVVNPLSLNTVQAIPATILNGSSGPGNVIGEAPGSNSIIAAQSWFENQDIVLTHNGSAEITSGNGTAVVKVYFNVAAV